MKWQDTTPIELFEVWPNKAVYWELTCMLEADWYIVPQSTTTDYTRDAIEQNSDRAGILRKYTKNVTAVEDVPLAEYELVITFDAFLQVPAVESTVFAYYVQEHWDRAYSMSLRRPVERYDLFLAHMLDADFAVRTLPQAISFPYLHDIDLCRSTFPGPKDESVYVDWRTLVTLAGFGVIDPFRKDAELAARRLSETLGMPIRYRGKLHEQTYGFADPPKWGDAAEYLRDLSRCKYYVGVGCIAGAGQGLAEAASLGCLCVGQLDRAYHRLICHPACLCKDIAEMPRRLKVIAESKDLQAEILQGQDEALEKYFARGPLKLLSRAVELKTRSTRNSILRA